MVHRVFFFLKPDIYKKKYVKEETNKVHRNEKFLSKNDYTRMKRQTSKQEKIALTCIFDKGHTFGLYKETPTSQ